MDGTRQTKQEMTMKTFIQHIKEEHELEESLPLNFLALRRIKGMDSGSGSEKPSRVKRITKKISGKLSDAIIGKNRPMTRIGDRGTGTSWMVKKEETNEGKTTKRQSGKAFFDRLRLNPTKEILKFGPEAQRKFAERIKAAKKQVVVKT
jgi:hypothetical protein